MISEKKFWKDMMKTSAAISSVTPNGNIPTVSNEGNVSSVFEVIIAMWELVVCYFLYVVSDSKLSLFSPSSCRLECNKTD